MNDVVPFLTGVRRSFESFEQYFDIIGPNYFSLPSMAKEALYSLYDRNCSPIVTFGPKDTELQQYFRKQINGGLGKC